jgi:protein O-GlcNAc transferase
MEHRERQADAEHDKAERDADERATPAQLYQAGFDHMRAGRSLEAQISCQRALALDPDHADTLHLIGLVSLQARQYDHAVEWMSRAIRVAPKPVYLTSLGTALLNQGRRDEALAAFDKAVQLAPDDASLWRHLGNALAEVGRPAEAILSYQQAAKLNPQHWDAAQKAAILLCQAERFEEALDYFDRALICKPDAPEIWLAKGNVCGTMGRHRDAVVAYERALAIDPRLAAAWVGRGNVLCVLDQHAEALSCFDRALELDPALAAAWVGQGNALSAARRNSEALAAYDSALAVDPTSAGAWLGRGNVFRELLRPDEALSAYDEALRCDGSLAQAHLGRGNVFAGIMRLEDALIAYARALVLRPDLAEAWLGRGNVLQETGDYAGALAAYDSALRYAPQLAGLDGLRFRTKLGVCNWDNFEAERDRLLASARQGQTARPFDLLSISSSGEDQYFCARSFSERSWPASREASRQRVRSSQRIRIAYMSADFRQHPTSYLMAEVFECHDRTRFETTAIAIGGDDHSSVRQRLHAAFARFVETRAMTDREIATLIEQSEVDILVDLMGFTRDARSGVIALRPAPIQVNYLGFPGTMGMRQIDYVIADRVVVGEGQRAFFSENVAYMPFTYQPNAQERQGDGTIARVDVGLPADAFVFCCFNNSYKILPEIFDVWMRILRQVEGSVLWLLEDKDLASANLRKEAVARGVAAERLIFARRAPRAKHLARHCCADLFLDTLPYNAHTTASDALLQGLPVLTCAGQTFAGRVAASLLTALKMDELITATLTDYERLAVALARSPQTLAGIRAKLCDSRLASPVFDIRRFTRHLETAYSMMVERHRAGLAPDDLVVPA